MDEELVIIDARIASICYFFFKDDDANRQSGASALSAILHQLFIQKPGLLKHAMHSFENHGERLHTMFSTLWDILEEAASDPEAGEIVCILDALDECKESAREELIKKLGDFYSVKNKKITKLKFLVISRPYFDIETALHRAIDDVSSIWLRGDYESEKISKEINLVIDDQIPRISSARNHPFEPAVQSALIEKLKSMPHRTYLWLHLIFDVIRRSLDSTKPRLENLVDKIPHTVDEVYEKILTRINKSDLREPGRRLLHIIVAAARPLTLREMNIALAIDEKLEAGEHCQSCSELDLSSEEHFRDKVRNLCGLFISVIDSKIYLIHQTAKEFLVAKEVAARITSYTESSPRLWKHSLKLIESNLILTKICISYLLLDELDREVINEYGLSKDWPREYDLLHYASEHWPNNFRRAQIKEDKNLLKLALKVCDVQSDRFLRWFGVHWKITQPYFSHPQNLTSLSVSSYLGLNAVVKLLLSQTGN